MTFVSQKDSHADETRHEASRNRRHNAHEIAFKRTPLTTIHNNEKDSLDGRPTSYHKGIPHDVFGLPDPLAFEAFKDRLNGTDYHGGVHASFDVPLGPLNAGGAWKGTDRDPKFSALTDFFSIVKVDGMEKKPAVRNWESPLGGHQYDLQGPDAGDLALFRAPKLGGSELTAEIAEVYAMAVLRDTTFEQMKSKATVARGGVTVGEVIDELKVLSWFDPHAEVVSEGTPHEQGRRAARLKQGAASLDTDSLFRGSVPGAKVGPYISQFLLIGSRARGQVPANLEVSIFAQTDRNPGLSKEARDIAASVQPGGSLRTEPEDGYIVFGAQRIDQRVNAHAPDIDHMTNWPLWLDVQNGADVSGFNTYYKDGKPRFIGTPRDLATFVHFDQLYQAYFNACLLMFANGVPFDFGFPSGVAHATRGSFATFGGPHVLSLMTEVASRALKAVRRQKFQHHLRGRPEQLAAMLTLVANDHGDALGNSKVKLSTMLTEMQSKMPKLLSAIAVINKEQNDIRNASPEIYPRIGGTLPPEARELPAIGEGTNFLLPMAFPEGSPMHASYGAGHATVAGACVTILKAYFEMSKMRISAEQNGIGQPLPVDIAKTDPAWWEPATFGVDGMNQKALFVADDDRLVLTPVNDRVETVTIEGELNKLAANISIGRNMAGVHYFTDYYDSLRMGERVAAGLLQEQAVTYCDPMCMRFTSFDGDHVIVSGDGDGNARIDVRNGGTGDFTDAYDEWWGRHA
ncbi:MAG: hypothetical protein H6945_08605 [Zoogloeaceae bacterium]|nr:hypothetical protein [Zoogloeaceae bacterium]